jgi:flagellar motility protein MotE (MotC chaperone)
MIRILQTKWTAVAAGALAYAVTTWLCLQPAKQFKLAADALRAAQAGQAAIVMDGPSWTFHNSELTELLGELREQRAKLNERSTQLDELQTRLNAERQEIFSVTQTVYQLSTQFDSMVTRVTSEEAVNLKKLAKVYGTMSPDAAARILKEMNDDQIVKILATMKESESAPILESFSQGNTGDAKRAAVISNRLRLTMATPLPSQPRTP